MERAIRVDDELNLVPLGEDDADALFALVDANRAALTRWLPFVQHTHSAGDERAFIALDREQRAKRTGCAFGLRVGDDLAGTIGLHDVIRPHDVGAVGYMLAPRFEGRGLMTRALRAVAEFAFGEFELHRLELLAAVQNHRSRAVAERAGFAQEAVLRERLRAPDGYDDCALYVRFAR